MNDARTKPEDLAGDHFPDFHRQRLEADGVAINQLFTRVIVLEEGLAKQRAMNEAFLAWFAALSQEERDGFAAPLAAAVRETLR